MLLLLLLYGSYSWYGIQRDACWTIALDYCVGRAKVVVTPSPAAVHQPHTHTVTAGKKATAWSMAAIVSLLLYCCTLFVGCEAEQVFLQQKQTPLVLILLCA